MKKFINITAVFAILALIPTLFAAYLTNSEIGIAEEATKVEAPTKNSSRVIDASVHILRSF